MESARRTRRLPSAQPITCAAPAPPPDTRGQAGDLLLTLASVECHANAGGPAGVPPAPLRDLVISTARLAGRTWLEGVADSTALFTALYAARQPPPPELDRIFANVLPDRFSLAPPATAA